MIENKKDERERQKKEREMAERKLQAIEQQYRNQMSLLSSKNSASKKLIAHTDHRSVIEGLESELKRENERQVNSLKTKLRREEARLDDDL